MSTSRSAIEALIPAFFFDGVESGGKIKFVKRGGASVATLSDSDAVLADGKPAVESVRGKDTELPYQVTVTFPDISRDHEINSIYARRLTGNSLTVQGLNLPIDMSASKAKQVAEVNLFTAWWGRQMASMSCSFAQLKLEPTDIITFINAGLPDQTMRVVKKDLGANGEIRLEMVRDEPSAYTSFATGTSGAYVGQTVPSISHSALYVLDMPLLRDQDDGFGYYMASAGYQSVWSGCVVYRSADAGQTYAQIETFVDPVTVGAATTAMPTFSGGNVFDEHSTVRVKLMRGTLASVTEAQVLSGSNTAYFGSEVIQFKTATLVSAGVYDLTGFLRGRRGTEWAMATHAAGDRFILANQARWSRERLQSSDVGLVMWFKPVSFGMTLDDTPSQSMTFTAAGLKPYAPILPGVGRDGASNITLNWVRRTRTGAAWTDLVDAQLGETSELYDVEIYDSTFATLKRTFTSLITQTASYTSAMQVTDFGSNQAIVYFKIYQKSAQFGRGYELKGQG